MNSTSKLLFCISMLTFSAVALGNECAAHYTISHKSSDKADQLAKEHNRMYLEILKQYREASKDKNDTSLN